MRPAFFFAALLFSFPMLGQVNLSRSEIEKNDARMFTLVVSALDSFERWAAREQVPVLGIYRPANIVVVRASGVVFREKIAQQPLILAVSTRTAEPEPELPVPGQNLFVNKINVAQARFPQWNGLGSVVSIKEFRFDSLDVDLQNRVYNSPNATKELTTHASIMATLVAGAGNSDLQGRGAAPGSALVSSGFGLLLPDADYAQQGVGVQNHAYGLGIENYYGANALAYDVCTQENPHLVHVFSAGNKGSETSETGTYAHVQGFANLTGNFKMAKNVLTVGAVDSFGTVAFFSSRGPAYDGRIKPDLVAFGHDGSSGAAALVSGAAAVLQQTFYALYDSLPGSGLMRAILINSADDRGRPGPDFEYGFGNLNMDKSVQTLVNHWFVDGVITTGQTLDIPIVVPANLRQFKISLAWNDVPASVGSAKALGHNLDMKLSAPLGQSWQPWVLNIAPNIDSLKLPAIRGVDTLNNIEQITIEYPIPGQYTVQVIAPGIFADSQSFSIAYSYDTLSRFQWVYPLRKDPAVAGQGAIVAWETNIAQATGRLEWKPIDASAWRVIDTAVVLHNGARRWLLPDTFVEAQLRMMVGANTFESDTFLISKELRLKIGFNCPDSIGLFWEKAADNASYMLSGLGQYTLEPLFETSDTFVSLPKNQFPQQRFAVTAFGQHHAGQSRRSAAPDITQQGVQCYQKSFFAVLNEENQVDISLELASLYGVVGVHFEKWDGVKFSPIKTFNTIDKERFEYTDPFPAQGRNQYRASITSSNNGNIQSDTAVVYFTGPKNWLVFPNPIASNGLLQVLSNTNGEAEFRLYDALGRLVLTQLLEEKQVEILLPLLPRGYYFFEVLEQGKRQWGGGLGILK